MELFKWRQAFMSEFGPTESTTRYVLLALSIYMDRDGNSCFPSTKTLAEKTRLSKRSVCTHIEKAEKEGWIKKEICGFSGKGWRRHSYKPGIPNNEKIREFLKNANFSQIQQEKGGEIRSPRTVEGGGKDSPREAQGGEPEQATRTDLCIIGLIFRLRKEKEVNS